MIEYVYSQFGVAFLEDQGPSDGEPTDAEVWKELFSVLERPSQPPLDTILLGGWSKSVMLLLEAGKLGPGLGMGHDLPSLLAPTSSILPRSSLLTSSAENQHQLHLVPCLMKHLASGVVFQLLHK